jgi:hypothetical protein
MSLKEERPTKFKEVLRITAALYLMFWVFTAFLTVGIYFRDIKDPSQSPEYGGYFLFAFIVPLLPCAAIWAMFLRDTRFRRDDPYRFSRVQLRFFEISKDPTGVLREKLESLGYNVVEKTDPKNFEFSAIRRRPKNLERFHEKRYPLAHKFTIVGTLEVDHRWYIRLEAAAVKGATVADFRNIIFDSTEELVDELQWRTFLKT